MLTITVKFMTGLLKVFKNVDDNAAKVGDGMLIVPIHQENDENGEFVSGAIIRMPLVNIMYVLSEQEADKGTVDGKAS